MNTGSNISNGNLDHRVIEGFRRQGDLPRFLIGHRLKGIADEIDNNLLDLNAVHPYFRGLVIEFKPQMQRQRSDTVQYKGAGFLDHRRKILDSSFRLIPADQLAEAADDLARPQ